MFNIFLGLWYWFKKKFYRCIVLNDSNAFFPGIVSRIENELKKIVCEKNNWRYPNFEIKVWDPSERGLGHNFSYMDASILGNLYNFEQSDYWISKIDWEEFGSNIILKKCSCADWY